MRNYISLLNSQQVYNIVVFVVLGVKVSKSVLKLPSRSRLAPWSVLISSEISIFCDLSYQSWLTWNETHKICIFYCNWSIETRHVRKIDSLYSSQMITTAWIHVFFFIFSRRKCVYNKASSQAAPSAQPCFPRINEFSPQKPAGWIHVVIFLSSMTNRYLA